MLTSKSLVDSKYLGAAKILPHLVLLLFLVMMNDLSSSQILIAHQFDLDTSSDRFHHFCGVIDPRDIYEE